MPAWNARRPTILQYSVIARSMYIIVRMYADLACLASYLLAFVFLILGEFRHGRVTYIRDWCLFGHRSRRSPPPPCTYKAREIAIKHRRRVKKSFIFLRVYYCCTTVCFTNGATFIRSMYICMYRGHRCLPSLPGCGVPPPRQSRT